MAILKKQTFGSICTAVAALLSLIGIIVYYINIGSVGYFQNASVADVELYGWLALVALAAVVAGAQISVNPVADKAIDVVSGLLRIAAPAGLMAAVMQLIASRAQGLAFIYFSNPEVLAEVQTASNLSSATGTIAAIVLLAVAAIASVVAAFFRVKK